MGAVRDNNFFVVHGWMINQLGLKGTELQIYAIIYGFSQAKDTEFTGSLQYLSDWVGLTRANTLTRLKSLVEKGLLVKTDIFTNGVKTCKYACVTETATGCYRNNNGGVTETATGCYRNNNGGVTETATNNISDIHTENISDKKESGGQAPTAPEKAKRFIPPTVEEVAAYCRERGNHVDAQRFVDYYTANGWMRGKTKLKDWRACVRTWERGSGGVGGGFQRPQQERSRIKTEADYAAGMEGWGAV
mgnify:FL=1